MPKPETKPQKSTSRKSPRGRAPRKDEVVLGAVEVAQNAAKDVARPDKVGEHLAAKMVDDRVALHQFECLDEGYPGWRWEVTVARAPRSKVVGINEVHLIPGDDALLAPAWVPWEERLRPEDVSRSDVLPYEANDERLQSGFEQVEEDGADVRPDEHMGLGRARVLSQYGLDEAATRWYDSPRGPVPGLKANSQCSSCGFLLKIAGSMGSLFGVCANVWSPDDGTVVSLDHGCGAHSETDQPKQRPEWPTVPVRVNDHSFDFLEL